MFAKLAVSEGASGPPTPASGPAVDVPVWLIVTDIVAVVLIVVVTDWVSVSVLVFVGVAVAVVVVVPDCVSVPVLVFVGASVDKLFPE
jgi:Flp pilus assembly protein TadB